MRHYLHVFLALHPLVLLAAGAELKCPGIFEEYARFHKDNKGRPGAKYLVYHCEGHDALHVCGGAGDRIRGMMFVLRLAIAANRVLLLKWSNPVALELFFKPTAFDWRTEQSKQYLPVVRFYNPKGSKLKLPNGKTWDIKSADFESVCGHLQTAIIFTNMWQNAPIKLPKKLPLNNHSRAFNRCLFNFMFDFSDEVKMKGRKRLQQIFGKGSASYAAAHVRMGGSFAEGILKLDRLGGGISVKAASDAAMACSNQLANCSGVNPTSTPSWSSQIMHTTAMALLLASTRIR